MAADNNFSLGPVPNSARKGVASLTMVMLGLTFFSASMWTGGSLGTGLSFNDFFLAVLIGNLILGIYTSFLGYIGASTGLSTHLLARFSFGSKGSWLPSALLGGTQVGWFGVGVAMFAIPVNKATGIDTNTLIVISGLLMTATVYFGISALMILSAIAVSAIALLGDCPARRIFSARSSQQRRWCGRAAKSTTCATAGLLCCPRNGGWLFHQCRDANRRLRTIRQKAKRRGDGDYGGILYR